MTGGLIDRALRRLIRKGRLEVTYASGHHAVYGEATEGLPDVAVRFTDNKVARELLMDLALAAGETFMDGRLVIERGDIMELLALGQLNDRWEHEGKLIAPGPVARAAKKLVFTWRSFNKPSTARRNVAHHYDIGNDLYRLMLDETHMQYSCAYWPREGMTLDEAQDAKLAHIAAKLALEPGQRVLDIGCGWGGMAIYLASKFDVKVLGITLSEEQLALARQRAEAAGVADRVRFELIDYRLLHQKEEPFDRIVSVGMFEHVGQPQFETFFRTCANLLKTDGVMLLHTIGRMGGPSFTDAFTDKYIFPGGYIPALSETVAASEKSKLIVADVETLRLHYAKTLREWYARCMANRDKIVAMYDERFFRMWTFYLAGAAAAFETGEMCNYQIQYTRDRYTLPFTRGYMEVAESRLTGN